MATNHGIITVNSPTTTGIQARLKSGLGTIKAALLLGSNCIDTDINVSGFNINFGFSDLSVAPGISHGMNYEDNLASTDVKSLPADDKFGWIADPGTDGLDQVVTFDSLITDGLQLDWTHTVAGGNNEFTTFLLKDGIDQVHVESVSHSGTGSVTVTPGFQADIILVLNTGQGSIITPNIAKFGFGAYDRVNNQYVSVAIHGGSNGDTTPDSAEVISTAGIGGDCNIGTGFFEEYFTLGNFTSTSFDITKASGTASRILQVMAIKLATGYGAEVGTFAAPTTTGVTNVISGLDFAPEAALFWGTGQELLSGSTSQCSINIGGCDADAEFAVGGWIEDSGGVVQNSNAGSHHRIDSCIYVPNSVGTLRSQANLSAFLNDGVELNFTTANDGHLHGYLVIGKKGITVPTGSDTGTVDEVETPLINRISSGSDSQNLSSTETGILAKTPETKAASDTQNLSVTEVTDLVVDGSAKFASDSGVIVGTELSTDGGFLLVDEGVVDGEETSSILKDPELKASTEAGTLSATDNSAVNAIVTTTLSTADIQNLSSVETASVVQFDVSAQKAATDVGLISDLRRKNLVLWSREAGNSAWGKSAIVVDPNIRFGSDGQSVTADRLNKPSTNAAESSISQAVTLEVADQEYVLKVRVDDGDGNPGWVWIDFTDAGVDVGTWINLATNPWTVGTTGADVLEVYFQASKDSPGSISTVYRDIIVRFKSDSVDLAGTLRFGFSDADGSKNITTHSDPDHHLYWDGMEVVKADQADASFITTTSTVGFVDFDRSFISQIDQFISASDSGQFSSFDSVGLDISGAKEVIASDSSSFSSFEVSLRGRDVAASDTIILTGLDTSEISNISYDPTWEDDDVPWGGLLLSSKDLAPVFSTGDSFLALGLGGDVNLNIFIERKAAVYDRGRILLGGTIYPQLIGPSGGKVLISMGSQDSPNGQVDWEGPYEFIIGQDISVDFAVAGQYLAVRFESTDVPVWRMSSYDVDYEIVGVH